MSLLKYLRTAGFTMASLSLPIVFSACTLFDSVSNTTPVTPGRPDKVTLFAPPVVYPTGFPISWTASKAKHFSGYRVYYRTNKSDVPPACAKTTYYRNDTTVSLTYLKGNTDYYFKVFVFTGHDSVESNEVHVRTSECKAGNFTGEKMNQMVLIPEGCYCDSGNNEATLSRSFYMDTTEITANEWKRVMDDATVPSLKPKVEVAWVRVILFCNKRSRLEQLDTCYRYDGIVYDTANPNKIMDFIGLSCDFSKNGYRLPTEDEWEYACRAGTKTDFYWGKSGNFTALNPADFTYPKTAGDSSEIDEYAWWHHNSDVSDNTPKEITKKKPNKWFLYDIVGNAHEFVWDIEGTRPRTNRLDYKGASSGVERVMKGGYFKGSAPELAASAKNSISMNVDYHFALGFRTVRTR